MRVLDRDWSHFNPVKSLQEQLDSTVKQLADAQEQVGGKDSQLEEMYGQLDSMQDMNQQLETDSALQKELFDDLTKQLG